MDCIFLRICYIMEETIPQPSAQLLDPMRKEGNVCQHWPARVVRWAQWARRPEVRAGGEEEDAASPFLRPRQSLLNSHPPLTFKELHGIAFVEDCATPRVCCIYSTPRKLTVVDRESAPQHNPTTGKNDAWWLKSPHQMTSHKRIWWLEGQSWLADFP